MSTILQLKAIIQMQIFILHVLCHNIFPKDKHVICKRYIYIHTHENSNLDFLSPPVMGLATELEMMTQAFTLASRAQVR